MIFGKIYKILIFLEKFKNKAIVVSFYAFFCKKIEEDKKEEKRIACFTSYVYNHVFFS